MVVDHDREAVTVAGPPGKCGDSCLEGGEAFRAGGHLPPQCFAFSLDTALLGEMRVGLGLELVDGSGQFDLA
ncbi:hypothetical protein [Gordonia bronchialis]|uniref:hypothetical protein n=1 Tax=Gordonia bronchialis TaxID=2054 RepID=UPI00226E9046|nr:hypothetical protein [Gordonia bronchialis]